MPEAISKLQKLQTLLEKAEEIHDIWLQQLLWEAIKKEKSKLSQSPS